MSRRVKTIIDPMAAFLMSIQLSLVLADDLSSYKSERAWVLQMILGPRYQNEYGFHSPCAMIGWKHRW